jgi:hypothetical protein
MVSFFDQDDAGELEPRRYFAEYERSLNGDALNIRGLCMHISTPTETFFRNIDHLTGFFKTCRKIKSFELQMNADNQSELPENLRKFLGFFKQLKYLDIRCNEQVQPNELFDAITDCCPKLESLYLNDTFTAAAGEYFQHTNLILDYYKVQ